MRDSKALTVVIPTHNRVELTTRAVNSVFCRRVDEVEVVVVDDCGSLRYEFSGSRNLHGVPVRVVRTSVNVGPGLARRFGVERCSGRAVALLDSDDVYEDGWLDEGLNQLLNWRAEYGGVFMAGRVRNGSTVTGMMYWLLTAVPVPCRAVASRLAVVVLNPFYTPSVIMSRDLCRFSDSLRHCEDYYTNAMAIFKAKKVLLSRTHSCSLSRWPGSGRGESANAREMWRGELRTRWAMLVSKEIPVVYRLLVPLGVLYQFIRASLKWVLAAWWGGEKAYSSGSTT